MIFAKNIGEEIAVFCSSFFQNLLITFVFEKNANFFRRKLAKIAENCDNNIDPWSP
jgi:hypothetical protein